MDKVNKNIINIKKIHSKLTGDFGVFLYKILSDILMLLLVVFALLLVSESVMPGLASSHMSFTRLSLVIFATLGMIIFLGKINEIEFEITNKKTVIFYGLMILSVILIVNSMLKFTWPEISIITIASFFLLYYLNKNFIK